MPPPTTTLQPDEDEGIRRVTAYGQAHDQAYIAIDGQRFTHSLILSPGAVFPWPPRTLAEITPDHVAMILAPYPAPEPQVILLGTGIELRFPAPTLFRMCAEKGIGVEVMTTAAACGTYNLLAGEGRAVVAALLLEDPGLTP